MRRPEATRRLSPARAALVGALALAVALPPAAVVAAPRATAEAYTFAFRDADVAMVAREVLGAVGGSYRIDPAVTGKISFRIEQRLTRDQLLAAFEAVLESNGLALVRNGDQLVVAPQAKAKEAAAVRRGGPSSREAGYEVVAVPLSYAQPSEVAKALEAISSAQTVVYTSDKLGLILLGGSGQQVAAAMETIKVFDQSAFAEAKIRWFVLNQAQATAVAGELDRIVQASGMVGVTIVPLRRLNGVLVFGRSADALNEIAQWVTRLDTTGTEAAASLWVYRPKASSAEALGRTLNSVLGTQSATEVSASSTPDSAVSTAQLGSAGAPVAASSASVVQTLGAPDDPVRIGVDKETNALIIFASATRWTQIQRILAEIDRTPRQILIEASIVEVTLNKDFQFGVDWAVLSDELRVASVNNDDGVIGPRSPGFSFTFLDTDIQAAVNALGSRTNIEVVSAPKIIALDNRTARLQVGDQVPIVTQSSQSRDTSDPALINTIDYRSTGVILTVTPRVTGDDQVLLDVIQEVSSVARTQTSGIDSPTIQQRRFESALVLHDGGVVALGGLINSSRTVLDSGVPGLKDIPAVGALFKTQSRIKGRSELIVLLSAKIIRDRGQRDAVIGDLLRDMKELTGRGLVPQP